MQIQTMPPANVLFFTTRTTLNQISEHVITVAQQLYRECNKQQLLPTGPLYWIYYDLDGRPDTVFTLEIALPVDRSPQAESLFLYKQLPPFKCAAVTHYGSWNNLPSVYAQLVPQLLQNGERLSNISRELYINIDLTEPANNITLVQVGIE